jgi:polyisoprenoid-binding protein YceI
VRGARPPRLAIALVAVFIAGTFAGCAAPLKASKPAQTKSVQASVPAATAVPQTTASVWLISSAESLLTIEVLRGGSLARLGHNHVIAARQIDGELRLADPLEQSSVALHLPVAAFTVDEPQLRALAGADFAAPVPESARSGTRAHKLGAALLDAEHYPQIDLRSTGVARSAGGLLLTLQIRIRDAERTLALPVSLLRTGDTVTVTGECMLRQSELGLTHFSIMMGALQVQDAMHLRFSIVAHPAARGGDAQAP